MSKKFASSVIALALASFCSLSQADSVQFTGFSDGSETVTATLGDTNPTLVRTVPAGGFDTILNGGATFESYCVDLYQNIQFNVPAYTEYVNVGLGHVFANTNAYFDLGRLFVTAGAVTTAVQEAAFQIAIWEIAYEKTGTAYNLGSGSASFSASAGAISLASGWLANLGSQSTVIGVLESPTHQDVIYSLTPGVTTAVPEPETYALLMAGLAAVGFMSRRRKR